ncbi:hypothetical protein PIB30_039074 [Stylosanthes scabra]|uniref:Uncharacterized protein n=1 Tax=Stylosanthes scabra TaxID=79078 RepID=A0ABU6VEV4_9FABA|nr:hypothetical protein [Stylosanthes scabra]
MKKGPRTSRSTPLFHVEREKLKMLDRAHTLYVGHSRAWDARKLGNWLPTEVVNQILAMSPPSPWKSEHQISWKVFVDGSLNLKSAYNYVSNQPLITEFSSLSGVGSTTTLLLCTDGNYRRPWGHRLYRWLSRL